jgi:beta-galactosidase
MAPHVKKYPPISPKCPHLLHGGDYNPDQWLDQPQILKEDMRLMKLAHCNAMTLGVFSWTALEPAEGRFTFGWLDKVMDDLAANGAFAVLATPSGAKPAWLSQKYPEILRVAPDGIRNRHGKRHNHCFTSPVYREKTRIINTKLAQRYRNHPALILWHVSNEYGGECHCNLCRNAFRVWLKRRYQNDLDALNKAWYTAFWSHRFTDWRQIDTPSERGEDSIHGMNLDWKRFVTAQTLDFMKNEIKPLKRFAPGIPVTTNFMGTYPGLDYWKLAPALDVISWDAYPQWHRPGAELDEAASYGLVHDMCRSFKKGKPFMLMESTPSVTNWHPVPKLKRPGMHLLTSLQAVAQGSDTVQYFQWRKSRGSCEKFHGAVVDHAGHENTRTFQDVAQLGATLEKLVQVTGSSVPCETALIFDWENAWAITDSQCLGANKDYGSTYHPHYKALWKRGIATDVIDMDQDFDSYKLLVAPMLYMVKPGVGERIERFVRNGGTFVATYWSGIVGESDLCFLGGFPGPLRKVLGIWDEEIDSLYDVDVNHIKFRRENELGLKGSYAVGKLCSLIHAETARTLAVYTDDFYAGRPAVTVNRFGHGHAYYLAARPEEKFLDNFYSALCNRLKIKRPIKAALPQGVITRMRTDGKSDFIFAMNYSDQPKTVSLGNTKGVNLCTGKKTGKTLALTPYGVAVIKTAVSRA